MQAAFTFEHFPFFFSLSTHPSVPACPPTQLRTHINILITLWLMPVHETNDELANNGRSSTILRHISLNGQSLVIGGKHICSMSQLPELLALGVHPPLGSNLGNCMCACDNHMVRIWPQIMHIPHYPEISLFVFLCVDFTKEFGCIQGECCTECLSFLTVVLGVLLVQQGMRSFGGNASQSCAIM